jgi:hypothetical protein
LSGSAGYSVDKWRVMKKSEVRALAPTPAPNIESQPIPVSPQE